MIGEKKQIITKCKPFALSRRELKTVWAAMDDAIRDRKEFIKAHIPKYSKPDKYALSMIRRTQRFIAKYQKMQNRIRKHFAAMKSADH